MVNVNVIKFVNVNENSLSCSFCGYFTRLFFISIISIIIPFIDLKENNSLICLIITYQYINLHIYVIIDK